MPLARITKAHKSAAKSTTFKTPIRRLRALHGVDSVSLGYIRPVNHGRAADTIRIVRRENGCLLLYVYAQAAVIEVRAYGDDLDAMKDAIAGLPGGVNGLAAAPEA